MRWRNSSTRSGTKRNTEAVTVTGGAESRVVLVGFDGATFSVLNPLMADGTMPFLADFVGRGPFGPNLDPASAYSGGVDDRGHGS